MPVALYPSSLATFTEKTDITDTILAAHVNALQLEVQAIEAILGTNPQGVSASVKARIAAAEASVGSLASSIASTLAGYVTLNTAQTVNGFKTFANGLIAGSGNGQSSSVADIGTDGGTRANSTTWGTSLAGSNSVIDTTFVAPPSGRVMLLQFARIGTAGVASGWFSSRVRVNPTGTIILDFDTDRAVYQASAASGQISGMMPRTAAGLTPGTTYRLQGGFRSTGGTSTFDSFGIAVLPSLA